MGLTTNVPDVEITSRGISVPDVSEILTGVLNDFNDAFGGNLNIQNVGTPQGLLSADITHNIALKNASLAYIISMFDPSLAEGRFLDALAQIYFIQRKPATATVVMCQCTGISGMTLPAGSTAVDNNGYIYESTGDAVFGLSGTVEVPFQCRTLGAIDCPVGTLNQIHTVVSGWDAITNLVAGVIGQEQETDRAFEKRRYDSVSKNAQGSVPALLGSVASVDGVTDVYVTENSTGETVTKGVTDYSLLPHSVYVAVVGGNDEDIAQAIWENKNAGSDMNGNTTVTVVDKESYVYPYPEYSLTFNRPTSVPIYFVVNIDYNENLPAEIIEDTKNAVISVFSGNAETGRARIGGTIYTAHYYGNVSKLSDYINILSIYVGTSSSTTSTSIEMGIDQSPVVTKEQIIVNLVGAPV